MNEGGRRTTTRDYEYGGIDFTLIAEEDGKGYWSSFWCPDHGKDPGSSKPSEGEERAFQVARGRAETHHFCMHSGGQVQASSPPTEP